MLNIERKEKRKVVQRFISFDHLEEDINDSYVAGKKEVIEIVLYREDGATNTLFAIDIEDEQTIIILEDHDMIKLVPNFENVGKTIKELVEDDFSPMSPPYQYTLNGKFDFELNIKER